MAQSRFPTSPVLALRAIAIASRGIESTADERERTISALARRWRFSNALASNLFLPPIFLSFNFPILCCAHEREPAPKSTSDNERLHCNRHDRLRSRRHADLPHQSLTTKLREQLRETNLGPTTK